MKTETEFWDELAVQSYKKLLKSKPNAAFLHKNLALAYIRQDKENKAIRSLQRAIKHDKEYLEAYYHLGTLYSQQDKPKEARVCFKKYNKILDQTSGRTPIPSIVQELLAEISLE